MVHVRPGFRNGVTAMAQIRWTGHPFVDAGLAALAAAVGVSSLDRLEGHHLNRACEELSRILLSHQALGLGIVGKAFVKGPLSQVFPNSELVNPSNWKGGTDGARTKFISALKTDLERALACLKSSGGEVSCPACGEYYPADLMVNLRNDKMPLLKGVVNFYPGWAWGVEMCGLCALAVRFLPMSIMRAGVTNRLWFIHTQSPAVAFAISKAYGWQYFNQAIAQNKALDFYSGWRTAGEAGTVLYLLCELLERFGTQLEAAYQDPLPTTVYVFSNDTRGGFVNALLIPNQLFRFLVKLRLASEAAFKRFWRELLVVPDGVNNERQRRPRIEFVKDIAERILTARGIIGLCLDQDRTELRGGWLGHRRYLVEVLGMPVSRLIILERLGIDIAGSDDAKKITNELRTVRTGNDIYAILLRLVRAGRLSHEELYTLLPPNEDTSAGEIRDILLAIIYEWQRCQERGEEFPTLTEPPVLTNDETLARLQQIGHKLLDDLVNPGRWVGQLQTARSSDRIRATYLTAVQQGALRFEDFIFLAPLGDRNQLWTLRDYLLAFLFDRAREKIPVGQEAFEETFNDGGVA